MKFLQGGNHGFFCQIKKVKKMMTNVLKCYFKVKLHLKSWNYIPISRQQNNWNYVHNINGSKEFYLNLLNVNPKLKHNHSYT
jgi:hypothetical protein